MLETGAAYGARTILDALAGIGGGIIGHVVSKDSSCAEIGTAVGAGLGVYIAELLREAVENKTR